MYVNLIFCPIGLVSIGVIESSFTAPLENGNKICTRLFMQCCGVLGAKGCSWVWSHCAGTALPRPSYCLLHRNQRGVPHNCIKTPKTGGRWHSPCLFASHQLEASPGGDLGTVIERGTERLKRWNPGPHVPLQSRVTSELGKQPRLNLGGK